MGLGDERIGGRTAVGWLLRGGVGTGRWLGVLGVGERPFRCSVCCEARLDENGRYPLSVHRSQLGVSNGRFAGKFG